MCTYLDARFLTILTVSIALLVSYAFLEKGDSRLKVPYAVGLVERELVEVLRLHTLDLWAIRAGELSELTKQISIM